jgi:predicted dithiol-disulfide oxidoreductase (DUF899 family)
LLHVGGREQAAEWEGPHELAARKALLPREKELTRLHDEVSQAGLHYSMAWVRYHDRYDT